MSDDEIDLASNFQRIITTLDCLYDDLASLTAIVIRHDTMLASLAADVRGLALDSARKALARNRKLVSTIRDNSEYSRGSDLAHETGTD